MNNNHWWKLKKIEERPHDAALDAIKNMEDSITNRNERWKRFLSLYHNCIVEHIGPGGVIAHTWRSDIPEQKNLALNPIESALSTLVSRIASTEINPKILTSTNSPDRWALKETAKKLQRFIIGEFRRGRVYQEAPRVFLDAGILGMGIYKVYAANGRINYERTFPAEIIVDEGSCMTSGMPRTMYQVKWVPAEVLAARFPKYSKVITNAAGEAGTIDPIGGVKIDNDLVQVFEGWHLPSSPEADDGKHIIFINDWTLLFEGWDCHRFPFAFFRWSPVTLGFWPQGLAEKGETLQNEINKLMKRIQDAHHLYSVSQTFVPTGTKINKNHLTNIPGAIVEYTGTVPPTVSMPNAVSSQVYSWLDNLYGRVIEGFGLNQLSMSGARPAGIESGVAIRELQDSQSGRFAQLSKAWEQMFVDLAEITIETAKRLNADTDGGYKGRYVSHNGIEDICWEEIDLDRDSYEIQVWPASILPQTPSGRLATVQDLLNTGFVDPKTALSLLNFPDLDSFTSMKNAAYDDIEKQIGEMLTKGEQIHPEPYQDLQLALEMATSALLRSRIDGVPQEKLELLQNYIEEIQDMLEPPQEPAQPMAMSAPGPDMPMPIPGPQQGPEGELPLATPEQLLQ